MKFDILILICRVEEFCFCSYDFCNSTTKTSSSFSTIALISLIFQFHICQNSNLLPSTYCLLLFTFGLFSYVTNASCLGYLASLPFLGSILTNRWWPSVIDPPPNPVTILNKYITGCLIVLSYVFFRNNSEYLVSKTNKVEWQKIQRKGKDKGINVCW